MGNKNENSTRTLILLAEDDAGHAGLIRRNLERAGLADAVLYFQDGQQVLDFFHRNGPGPADYDGATCILLLDIRLPKVDGMEVLRRLKADPGLCGIPVYILSTMDDPCVMEQCVELGCAGYLVKPVDYDEFAAAIQRLGQSVAAARELRMPTVFKREKEADG